MRSTPARGATGAAVAGQGDASSKATSEAEYKRILQARPNDFDALLALGVIASRRGDNDRAAEMARRAAAAKPSSPHAHFNLGVALQDLGQPAAAADSYRQALAIDPEFARACNNLGNVLLDLGAADEATTSFRRAIEIQPAYAEAHYNLGNQHMSRQQYDDAIACYRRAVEINPKYARAYNNLGNALKTSGKAEEAVASYRKAFSIAPAYARAHYNLAVLHDDMGRADLATESLRRALHARPDFGPAAAKLLQQQLKDCAWRDLASLNARLDRISDRSIERGERTDETPLLSITRRMDAAFNHRVAKSWSDDIAQRAAQEGLVFDHGRSRPDGPRIKIGYLSNNLGDHPVTHLMRNLFRSHDRREFEVAAYSYGPDDGSRFREDIERDCDRFVDLHRLPYTAAAERIHGDGVDILVDLNGHTLGASLEICALRPAPVQVGYLGFPGTAGAAFLDYIVTDEIVTPQDQAAFYSEAFAWLPHCYQVNDSAQIISDTEFERRNFDLPADGFVFCSFNQSVKIEPVMFDVWMRILEQVPGSVIWLQRSGEAAHVNLKLEAEAHGVASERLLFVGRARTKEEHLARLRLADLALDTRIYNGHTTTSDMLWAGLPVVTLQGSHFASRVSASLLTAVGLPELIATGAESYQALAVRLARDAGALAAIRRKLDENRTTAPLFDTARFARNLERAYREMWEIYLAGDRPRPFKIRE